MKKEFIKYRNTTLALILRNGDFPKGLHFHTRDKDFIQLATWNYERNKKTIPHTHKIAERIAMRTQEVLFIKRGKVMTEIFTNNGQSIKKKFLKSGDIAIFFNGGHSFKVLEDKTQVLEIKNGPYLGIEKDKKVLVKI